MNKGRRDRDLMIGIRIGSGEEFFKYYKEFPTFALSPFSREIPEIGSLRWFERANSSLASQSPYPKTESRL